MVLLQREVSRLLRLHLVFEIRRFGGLHGSRDLVVHLRVTAANCTHVL